VCRRLQCADRLIREKQERISIEQPKARAELAGAHVGKRQAEDDGIRAKELEDPRHHRVALRGGEPIPDRAQRMRPTAL
jgi:hypothetical protein